MPTPAATPSPVPAVAAGAPSAPAESAAPRFGVGLLIAGTGSILASVIHHFLPQVGALTWAVALGALLVNLDLLPQRHHASIKVVTTRTLRIGVVLLGLSLSVVSIAALGGPLIALVVVTLFSTLLATAWLGRRLGLGRPRSLLIATGFAICGASAIAAMEENAEADEEDVAVAIAMVTVAGTIAMVTLPLLQGPLGLSTVQYGAWAGASVHEVGQVVAAATPAGAAAVGVAIVVKLTRVLLLAPVVASVSVLRRRRLARARAEAGVEATADIDAALPPLVPLFVLGFLAMVAVRSLGLVPEAALGPISTAQNLVLGAALFGMGTGVRVRSLVRSSGRAFLLAAISTLVVASVALAGVVLLV